MAIPSKIKQNKTANLFIPRRIPSSNPHWQSRHHRAVEPKRPGHQRYQFAHSWGFDALKSDVRWTRVTTLATCVSIFFATSCSHGHLEPFTGGRPLSDWVVQVASTDIGSPRYQEAVNAIQIIGTNALPFLVTWVKEAKPRTLSNGDEVATREAMAAPTAFALLGRDAEPAIPDLTKVLTNSNPIASACAAHALAKIGRAGLNPLTSALTNLNPTVRRNAAEYLLFMGTNALPAIPALRTATNDPDPTVRKPAAITLKLLYARAQPTRPCNSFLRSLRSFAATLRYLCFLLCHL